MIEVRFTKLKDETWGVRVVGEEVQIGDVVYANRKGGGSVPQKIEEIIWTGTDDNGFPVTIARASENNEAKSGQSHSTGVSQRAQAPSPQPKKERDRPSMTEYMREMKTTAAEIDSWGIFNTEDAKAKLVSTAMIAFADGKVGPWERMFPGEKGN